MARLKAEVPWDVGFPQVCARCTSPAAKTMRIQRQKPSAQRWFFWGGLIGSAIAGARKGGSLRFEVPYCADCYRQERILLGLTWGVPVLSLVFLCGPLAYLATLYQTSHVADIVYSLGLITVVLALVIATPALAIALSKHKAVHIKSIDEPNESVILAFRSQPYFEGFTRENLEKIVTFSLSHGEELPLPINEAISVVGRRIDERNPRSPDSLKGYFERGQLYLRAEMYSAALADLDCVVAATGLDNPYFLEARFSRGQAYMQLGNRTQARADLESYMQAASDRSKVRQAKRWINEMRRS